MTACRMDWRLLTLKSVLWDCNNRTLSGMMVVPGLKDFWSIEEIMEESVSGAVCPHSTNHSSSLPSCFATGRNAQRYLGVPLAECLACQELPLLETGRATWLGTLYLSSPCAPFLVTAAFEPYQPWICLRLLLVSVCCGSCQLLGRALFL